MLRRERYRGRAAYPCGDPTRTVVPRYSAGARRLRRAFIIAEHTMKRCLVYDPYLATLGGGERYVYALAEALESTVEVDLAASEAPDPARLDALQFSVRPVTKMHPLEFPEASAAYDLAVYLTNSPPPPSYAAHSLLVVQFPFEEFSGEATVHDEQRHALERYACVVYSEFARDWLLRRWGREATILYPPVDIGTGAPENKGDLILGVGRFFSAEHSKRQDVLVSAFRELTEHPGVRGMETGAGGRCGGRCGWSRLRGRGPVRGWIPSRRDRRECVAGAPPRPLPRGNVLLARHRIWPRPGRT